jgi:hypothetical protein
MDRLNFHLSFQERAFGEGLYSKDEWQVHSNAQRALVAVQHVENGQMAKEGALLNES